MIVGKQVLERLDHTSVPFQRWPVGASFDVFDHPFFGLEGDLIVVLFGARRRLRGEDGGNDETLIDKSLHRLVLRAHVRALPEILGDPADLLDALIEFGPRLGAVV